MGCVSVKQGRRHSVVVQCNRNVAPIWVYARYYRVSHGRKRWTWLMIDNDEVVKSGWRLKGFLVLDLWVYWLLWPCGTLYGLPFLCYRVISTTYLWGHSWIYYLDYFRCFCEFQTRGLCCNFRFVFHILKFYNSKYNYVHHRLTNNWNLEWKWQMSQHTEWLKLEEQRNSWVFTNMNWEENWNFIDKNFIFIGICGSFNSLKCVEWYRQSHSRKIRVNENLIFHKINRQIKNQLRKFNPGVQMFYKGYRNNLYRFIKKVMLDYYRNQISGIRSNIKEIFHIANNATGSKYYKNSKMKNFWEG